MDTLLHEISLLLQEEKLLKKEKEKRGENFNVFEIMHAQNNEVHTHSAIIAQLLNPKGRHGCKAAFLTLFLEMFLKSEKESSIPDSFDIDRLDLSRWNTYIEYYIGEKTEDGEYGGRLDILIESAMKDKAIIIENKIHAADQTKQLYRYKNYAQNRYGTGNYIIIYLTLDGHRPNEKSIKGDKFTMNENEDFYLMSYGSFVLDWLSSCNEKASSKPLVRETITQYYNLIAILTHQNMEKRTTEELVELLAKSKDNVSAIYKIQNVRYKVLNKVCNETLLPQIKEIAEEMQLECDCSEKNWSARWNGQFFFSKPAWKHFCIGFEFMGNNFTDFNYGVRYKDEIYKKDFKEDKDIINQQLGGSQNDWWASFKSFKYHCWDNEETIEDLYNGKIKNEIKQMILEILGKVDEAIL